jgi:flagellar basal-body rod protein FlgG
MVNMIVAQRAYEINSKCITTADEMLGIANNLRR